MTDFASLHSYTGTAGGNTVGVAPCSNIYGLKVIDDYGNKFYSTDVVDALKVVKARHVSKSNAKSVVSMSLAGPCHNHCTNDYPLFNEISSMYDLGILIAVAAGNYKNANACLYNPAASPKAITVAASDGSDNFASYSNTGPCVDIIAPGSDINSAWPTPGKSSYKILDGTSMATPHVAGTLALLLQKRSYFTFTSDLITKALICDAEKYKIQNIPVQSFGTSVNRLLQVPKSDGTFADCNLETDWRLRLEGNVLVFRYMNTRDLRIAFYPGKKVDYGTRRFYRNEADNAYIYRGGNWAIQEEDGVLCIRDMSSSADHRFAFFPGNGNSRNYGSVNDIYGQEVGTKVLLKGIRWSIQVENGVLVFRDMRTPGDHRFAFWQSKVNM